MAEENRYIEERDGSYYLRGHRIPLISIIHLWNQGAAPESIRQSFSTLNLTEVYGAILYYLEHREPLDAHFKEYRAEEDRIFAEAEAHPSPWRQELLRRIEAIKLKEQAS